MPIANALIIIIMSGFGEIFQIRMSENFFSDPTCFRKNIDIIYFSFMHYSSIIYSFIIKFIFNCIISLNDNGILNCCFP